MSGDFNVKLVNAYKKYIAIHRYKGKTQDKIAKAPLVKFLGLTTKG